MIHIHIPKCSWVNVVLTDYYLIDMVLISLLSGKTPLSVFYPDRQLFYLAQKTFGIYIPFIL